MSETHDIKVAKMRAAKIVEQTNPIITSVPTESTIRRILTLASKWEGDITGESLCKYIQNHFND